MRHRLWQSGCTLALALIVAGCGDDSLNDIRVCTDIGCSSGLTVRLASKPVGTYKVEVFAAAPDQQPVSVYECTTVASCQQNVFFPSFVPTHPYVRVTSAAGTRLTEITQVIYQSTYPNGRDCPDECRNASVDVSIP